MTRHVVSFFFLFIFCCCYCSRLSINTFHHTYVYDIEYVLSFSSCFSRLFTCYRKENSFSICITYSICFSSDDIFSFHSFFSHHISIVWHFNVLRRKMINKLGGHHFLSVFLQYYYIFSYTPSIFHLYKSYDHLFSDTQKKYWHINGKKERKRKNQNQKQHQPSHHIYVFVVYNTFSLFTWWFGSQCRIIIEAEQYIAAEKKNCNEEIGMNLCVCLEEKLNTLHKRQVKQFVVWYCATVSFLIHWNICIIYT